MLEQRELDHELLAACEGKAVREMEILSDPLNMVVYLLRLASNDATGSLPCSWRHWWSLNQGL